MSIWEILKTRHMTYRWKALHERNKMALTFLRLLPYLGNYEQKSQFGKFLKTRHMIYCWKALHERNIMALKFLRILPYLGNYEQKCQFGKFLKTVI